MPSILHGPKLASSSILKHAESLRINGSFSHLAEKRNVIHVIYTNEREKADTLTTLPSLMLNSESM